MRRHARLFATVVLSGVVAIGCGGSADSIESADEATPTTSSTPAPSPSTADPMPSTAASPKTLTAAQVVDGLRSAGLPIGAVEVFDESNDPNERLGRPGQYTSKASFADTRIGADVDGVEGGGDVEAFDDSTAMSARADYLEGFADRPPIGGWYQYTAGNAILRVPFALTPDQAEQYDSALQALFG